MAFKLSFATLLIGSLLLPGILWAEKSEDSRDDALMTVQSGGPVRYSTLSNAELFAAEREMREKIGKDPSNARYYFMLSDICTVLFDRTRKQKGIQSDEWLFKSADALEKVVMIDPSNKTAHYNLGVVYKRQGKMERAREELKKTIRLCDPKRDGYILLACWMEIGSIYMEQGFVEEAKEAFLKAVPGWNGKLNWTEMEVKNDSFGKPSITLAKTSKFKLINKKINLTISHDRNYAIAMVAVEKK